MGDGLPSWWTTAPDGHLESIDHEIRTHVVGDRPAHDSAAEGVEDHGQVGLAGLGRMLGDAHDPQTVRFFGIEGPLDQVVRGLGIEITPRAAAATAPVDAGHSGLAHQALDAFARAADVLTELELGVDP